MSVAYKLPCPPDRKHQAGSVHNKCSGWIWTVVRAVLLIGLCFMILYPLIVKFTSSICTLTICMMPVCDLSRAARRCSSIESLGNG